MSTILEIDLDDGPAPAAKVVEKVNGAKVNGHHEESFETAKPVPIEREVIRNHGATSDSQRRSSRSDVGGSRAEVGLVGRTLPSSDEAEIGLLGCIFVDSSVLDKCDEARVGPETFFDSKRAAIFRVQHGIKERGLPVDTAIVAEELKAAPEFLRSNVYAEVMQVSEGTSTTAQATYFIDRIRQLSTLRALIRRGTSLVERAYDPNCNVDELVEKTQSDFKAVADQSAAALSDRLSARAFSPGKKLEKPRAIYSVGDTQISSPGNLTTIYSQAKTGKSSLIGAMLAAAMTNPSAGHDCLGITGPNYDSRALLHFDTEQSPYDWQQLVLSSMRRVGTDALPPWLLSYTLTGLPASECQLMIESALRAARRKFGGVHSIIIDGVADLVNDPNDSEECFPLITRLHGMAIEYDTAIISVLHMNPGSDVKGRGHLGSQLERKSESNLTLTKDGEVTTVSSTKQRGKAITKDRAPSFKWSDEHQMHRLCSTPEEVKKRAGGRPEVFAYNIYAPLMPKKTDPGLPLARLARILEVNKPITTKQLFNALHRWAEDGAVEIIDSPSGKLYRQAV